MANVQREAKLVAIVGMIAVLLPVLLLKVIPPLLPVLADDRHIRLRWLKIGVGMFVLGSLLQFIATF